jgi:NADP-dependent 3-hydroxy acid dehydrogenase YdfG
MNDPLHVVITGASSGLGEAIACEYARRGARVGLYARRADLLERVAARCRELGAADARPLVGDVRDRDAIAAACAELDAAWGRIDRGFLNAGGSGDRFKGKAEAHYLQCCAGDDLTAANFSADSAEYVISVNYLGVVNWLDPLLARMRTQRSGTITVTGSIAADGNLPRSGPYTASKAALRALVDGLRHDAAKRGVRLCLIECGWFISELTSPKSSAPFVLTTAEAARRAVDGAERGQRLIRFPWQLSTLSRLGVLVPRRLQDRFWDRMLPPLSTISAEQRSAVEDQRRQGAVVAGQEEQGA